MSRLCRAGFAATLLLAACAPAPRTKVVIALPVGPVTRYPDEAVEEFQTSVLGNVYEALVTLDRALGVRGSLAESWYNEDDLTWVFKLRAGLKLHDGRPLHAMQIAASIERSRTRPESRLKGLLTTVQEVTARDERTLAIRTREPDAAIPSHMAAIPIWIEGGRPGEPIGSGPYQVTSFVPGKLAVLQAVDRGDHPLPVQTLEFRVIPDAAERFRGVADGTIDLTLDIPQETYAPTGGNARSRTLSQKGLRIIFLGAGGQAAGARFADVRLRRALALAVDRNALVARALGGHGEVVDQLVAPTVFGYDPAMPPLKHDRAEARRLIQEAGADGLALDLEFMPHKYRSMEAVAQQVADDLRSAGLKITLRPREPPEFFARLEQQAMSLYIFGWMSFTGEAGTSYDYLVRSRREGLGQYNGSGYSSPVVDGLLHDAAGQLDADQRRQILRTVAARLNEDLPLVPLYCQGDLYAVARDLAFEPRIDRFIRGIDLGWR